MIMDWNEDRDRLEMHPDALTGMLVRALEASDGFAAADAPNGEFLLVGIFWEVASRPQMPCCGVRIALVRRVGSVRRSWGGITCPQCGGDATWTLAIEDRGPLQSEDYPSRDPF